MLSVIPAKRIANQTSACYMRNIAKHMQQRYQLLTNRVSSTGCRAPAFHIVYKVHGQSHFELNFDDLLYRGRTVPGCGWVGQTPHSHGGHVYGWTRR